MLSQLKQDLQKLADPERAKNLSWFFKTGKGEYGEGDIFIGITVPQQRTIAKKYAHLSDVDLKKLLQSKIHEHRLVALLILVEQYQKSKDEKTKKNIVDFYLANTTYITNWDLVDLSSHKIVGDYLLNKPAKDRKILYQLAKSKNLWEKRIAIISTFTFINNKQFTDSLKLAEILLNDKHDLIHKAVGWMLREIGKKNQKVEEKFLQKYYKVMPRTMLRYSIEKFAEKKRKYYLKK